MNGSLATVCPASAITALRFRAFMLQRSGIRRRVWTKHSELPTQRRKLPVALYRTAEEEAKYARNQAIIDDYIDTMVLRFILGAEELNEGAWESFKAQLKSYGAEENISVVQASFNRYLAR